MASKIYIDDLPSNIQENHKHNNNLYTSTPLHPALLIQDTKLSLQTINTLLKIFKSITGNEKIRLALPKKFKSHFTNERQEHNILLKEPLPFWAQILANIPFLSNAAYGALDFKNLGNFVVSVGTGPNLFVTPHITTFHIAIINQRLNTPKLAHIGLVRPEILIVLKNNNLATHIKTIRKLSLGKPTFSITDINDLKPILQKALSIYNKMPFRWVEDLKEFYQNNS